MIIFDLDGTLWNTMKATKKSTLDIVKKHNIIDFDINRVEKGMGLFSFEENLSNYFPNVEKDEASIYLNEICNKTNEYITKGDFTLYYGVKEVIRKLSKKYKLGIITNNKNEYVQTFLQKTNMTQYFTDYIGTASYGITKSEAIATMCINNNEMKSIYVGDIQKDHEASIDAKIEFIHAKYGFDEEYNYMYYINNLYELPQVIETVLSKLSRKNKAINIYTKEEQEKYRKIAITTENSKILGRAARNEQKKAVKMLKRLIVIDIWLVTILILSKNNSGVYLQSLDYSILIALTILGGLPYEIYIFNYSIKNYWVYEKVHRINIMISSISLLLMIFIILRFLLELMTMIGI